MAKGGDLDRFLIRCRELSQHDEPGEAAGRRLAVLAAVASRVAVDAGLTVSSEQVPLLSHLDAGLALPSGALPAGWSRPELLSAVCDATQPTARRRAAGAFYTPAHVAARITHEVLSRIDAKAEDLRICDPAAGGGAFLLAAVRYLVDAGVSPRQAVEECVYAVDLDPVAVTVADAALALVAWDAQAGPPAQRRVLQGNALLGARVSDVEQWVGADESEQLSFLDAPRPALASGPALARQLDAWTALQFWPDDQKPDAADLLAEVMEEGSPGWGRVAVIRNEHVFVQWDLLAPDGFDAVIGNPPFLNQLESATARSPMLGQYLRREYGDIAGGYSDTANLFLALAARLTRPGGAFGLIVPESILATRDAGPLRAHLQRRATMSWIWRSVDNVFDASVQVACPVFVRGDSSRGLGVLARAVGEDVQEVASLHVNPKQFTETPTWSWIFSDTLGIPTVEVPTTARLGDLCVATADFRDQFYGLVPHVREAAGMKPTVGERALVTVGLIDPARNLWGHRETRFAKSAFVRPVVLVDDLLQDPALGGWAADRLVPKLLLSTQTKVLEVLVDDEGALLPSIPTITITCSQDDQWRVAAALSSPVLTAWALRHYAGAALSHDAIKLSAKQVMELPAPTPSPAWDAGANAFRRASQAQSEVEWRDSLDEMAWATSAAFGLNEESTSELVAWWRDRLPVWDRSSKRAPSR